MDADDVVVGTVDFSGLESDAYAMQFRDGVVYWRRQLFRDGVPWRYQGVLHEVAVCDVPHTAGRLEGDYHIHSRRLGARNHDPQKYVRDAEILQAEVDRNPDDSRSVFYLAQSYRDAGNHAQARRWYERRAVISLAWWYDICFDDKPEIVFRIRAPRGRPAAGRSRRPTDHARGQARLAKRLRPAQEVGPAVVRRERTQPRRQDHPVRSYLTLAPDLEFDARRG